MGKIEFPSEEVLPPGPTRDLTARLHDLYDAARWPSLRQIQRDMAEADAPGTASHERIRKILMGEAAKTRWVIIESIVRGLTLKKLSESDLDALLAEIDGLWSEAYAPDSVKTRPKPDKNMLAADGAEEKISPDQNRNSSGKSPDELNKAAALASVEELVSLFESLVRDGNQDGLTRLTSLVSRTRSPYTLISLIEKMRRRSLHNQVDAVLRQAVASIDAFSLIDLVGLFYKEDWRLDVVLSAIAALRSAEDVAAVIDAMGERPEAAKLRRLFEQIRNADEVAELAERME